MSNAFLQDFDAIAHAAFASVGLAEASATYAPRSGSPRAVDCYVDRSVKSLINRGLELRSGAALVTVIRTAGAAFPVERDVIEVGGDSFEIVSVVDYDELTWVIECRA